MTSGSPFGAQMKVVGVEFDVRAFLEGDPVLITEIRTALRGVVGAFGLPDAAVREELVQEALGRLYLSLSSGRFRCESSLRTYAQNVARYTCLEYVRRRRFERELDADALRDPGVSDGPEERLLRAERHRSNLRALAALPDECREIFRLIFVERLSYREIGHRLRISEGAVKSRVRRCRLTSRGDRS